MKHFQSLILPVGCLVVSTFLLTLPGNKFPQENWFDKIWLDKWVHLGMFAVMVWLWCRYFYKKQFSTSPFIWIVIAAIIYGVGMEFVQRYMIANRSFDVGDIVADTVGAFTGWIYSKSRYKK